MADRGIRSLVHLQNSASTARLLNLLAIWRRHKDDTEYSDRPFFRNKRLNRVLILKHRLRRDEFDLFDHPKLTETKIIFAVDPSDLKLGGKFVFVGQRNAFNLIETEIGQDKAEEALDFPLLELLDKLPSFDPFLMREELKRSGYKPADFYLELSDADLKRIFAFVQSEIEPLVRMSLGGDVGLSAQTSKLVSKILSNQLDSDMQPLRQVLRLNESDFAEGVFCWKGFLYYKWVYQNIKETSKSVLNTILRTRPMGLQDEKARKTIDSMRISLRDKIVSSGKSIGEMLGFYDHAYAELTKNGNSVAFRDFLLKAPAHFADLGERLGVLQHITSFCQFRFPANERVTIGSDELIDIFQDFEAGLPMLDDQPDLP